MEKPDLDRMWETFVEIGPVNTSFYNTVIFKIRSEIYPLVSRLKKDAIIKWYHFLIHTKNSVPTTQDDDNAYFHIRFSLEKDINPDDVLPHYCVLTRKMDPPTSILGINKSLLKNEKIEEAWRIIGEQSEWVINLLAIHKDDVELPPKQIKQFLHFFHNMTATGKRDIKSKVQCPGCGLGLEFRTSFHL